MKKNILFTAVMLFCMSAGLYAQKMKTPKDSLRFVGKGVTMVGGSFNYGGSSAPVTNMSTHNFSLNAHALHFVHRNIAVGGYLVFSLNSVPGGPAQKIFTWGIGGGPTVRFYKMFNRYFGIFEQSRVGVMYSRIHIGTPASVGENLSIGLQMSPGLTFFPVRRLSVDLLIGGLYLDYSNLLGGPGSPGTLNYGISLLQGTGIGVNYFIGR
ncbi:MAG: hypothetical protein ACT6QS_02420 [Flavobacteriales bacterium]